MAEWNEVLERIKQDKRDILRNVYYDANGNTRSLEAVYANQKDLSSMAMNIYTEVGGALIDALHKDGIDTMAWASVSTGISQLVFVSVPTAAVLREQYRDTLKAVNSGAYSAAVEDEPKPGVRVKMRKYDHIPQSAYWIAGFGLAVPLLVSWSGRRYVVLAKLLPASCFACIALEIVAACIFSKAFAKKRKQSGKPAASAQAAQENEEMLFFREALNRVEKDNADALEAWFKNLEDSLRKEIARRAGMRGTGV